MALVLRQRWQRQILRACLPVFEERAPLLIDAGSSACRVALRAGGARRWLRIELVENRGMILGAVKVALDADELVPTYVSHGTSGEPLVQGALANIDGSRTLTWERPLDAERIGVAIGSAVDQFWTEWCRGHAVRGRAAAAVALGTARREVFVEARRGGGILPSGLTTADFLECSGVHPFIGLGADATLLGATPEQAIVLASLHAQLRTVSPPQQWADATPLAQAVGDA